MRLAINPVFLPCLIALLVTSAAQAAILNVPEDYPTLKTAVDASQDGDTILLNAEQIEYGIIGPLPETDYRMEGILVTGKSITIRGTLPGQRSRLVQNGGAISMTIPPIIDWTPQHRTNLLVIRDADVRLEHVEFPDAPILYFGGSGRQAAPIQVIRGWLRMNNVHHTGTISVYGNLEMTDCVLLGWAQFVAEHPYRLLIGTSTTPALNIRDNTGGIINLEGVTIDCASSLGYRAIAIQDSQQCHITIRNSTVIGGSSLSQVYWLNNGLDTAAHGIEISNSHSIRLDCTGSVITGGTESGFKQLFSRYNGPYPTYADPEIIIGKRVRAGNGLHLSESDARLNGGQFIGGTGADGLHLSLMNYGSNVWTEQFIRGGDGGHGLSLAVNSTLLYREALFVAGEGGLPISPSPNAPDREIPEPNPTGNPGQPIVTARGSRLEPESHTPLWRFYR